MILRVLHAEHTLDTTLETLTFTFPQAWARGIVLALDTYNINTGHCYICGSTSEMRSDGPSRLPFVRTTFAKIATYTCHVDLVHVDTQQTCPRARKFRLWVSRLNNGYIQLIILPTEGLQRQNDRPSIVYRRHPQIRRFRSAGDGPSTLLSYVKFLKASQCLVS